MDKNDLEAVKLLADWSKWLASLQTAVITLTARSTASGTATVAKSVQPGWMVAAIALFLISLLSASFLLFALPGVAQRLPPRQGQDIMRMGTFNGGGTPVVV